ncbi:50S ribosomal protein L25 [Acanthopleuribacter pedis]|uniref:Large ribosomal subunit protein bL25 n=1 Tax=Acanthopleuribacter pedis TaxID=442870 RepID=A0A8J7Q9K7_9BACT|nr:50S ribosomal protein L25 [Acanthopleuribacter pedis]MBO1319944.1 50S ribosomal protein L25 [Acanthopleuribacter pedis]
MSNIPEIVVFPRELTGKGAAGRLRKEGMIPSVVYGLDVAPSSISVEPKTIGKILHSEKGLNAVVNLRLDNSDQTRHVMIKDLDRHPVTGRLTHVDFIRVDMDKEVDASIELEISGLPKGVKEGGVLTVVRHDVEVRCLPKFLPGVLKVDVSSLGIDDAKRVSDLPELEGVTYKLDAKRVIAVVHLPSNKNVVDEPEEEEA